MRPLLRTSLLACATAALASVGPFNVYAQAPPSLDARATLRIGALDGPVALTHVASLLVHGRRLYITQSLDKQIRVLSTSGEPVAVWGRPGDGPGEFRRPIGLTFVDDQIVVVDHGPERFTFLDTAGNVTATLQFPHYPSPTHDFYYPAFFGAEGRVVLFGTLAREVTEAQREGFRPGIVMDTSGNVIDSLSYRFGNRRIVVGTSPGSFSTAHPIVDGALLDISPRGEVLVIADHDAEGGDLSLLRYFLRTGARDTVRLPIPRVRIPDELADSVRADLIQRFSGVIERFGRRAVERAIEIPSSVPAVDWVMVTDDAEVWLRAPNLGKSNTDEWLVIDSNGELAYSVRTPKDLEIMDRDDEYLWAHHQDEYFVSYIVRLELTR